MCFLDDQKQLVSDGKWLEEGPEMPPGRSDLSLKPSKFFQKQHLNVQKESLRFVKAQVRIQKS